MRRGQRVSIEVNGEQLSVTYLGKGLFTTAYRCEDIVYLFTRDPTKDAYRFMNKNPHLPTVWHGGYLHDDYVYVMPYYEPLRAKHKDAWRDRKVLEKLYKDAARTVMDDMGSYAKAYRNAYRINNYFENAVMDSNLSDDLKHAVRELVFGSSNYGCGVAMEFDIRNMGVNASGQLVLRDVLFDAERLLLS